MKRLKYSLYATLGILVLALVLTGIGPKRVMAALGYTPVRDVDGPGRQPFATMLNNVTAFPGGTVAVPAGRRLVITAVTAFGSPDAHWFTLATTANGATTLMKIPFTSVVSGVASFGSITGHALAEADPSSTLAVFVSGGTGFSFADVTLHGYYVDVP